MMILHQALDVEVFKREVVKLPKQIQTRLVEEIQPLPFDLLMLLGQQLNSFCLPQRLHQQLNRCQKMFEIVNHQQNSFLS